MLSIFIIFLLNEKNVEKILIYNITIIQLSFLLFSVLFFSTPINNLKGNVNTIIIKINDKIFDVKQKNQYFPVFISIIYYFDHIIN
jgi:hypothetical protein